MSVIRFVTGLILFGATGFGFSQVYNITDIPSNVGSRYRGGEVNSSQSNTVDGGGDFNGDGLDDVVSAGCLTPRSGNQTYGSIYVFFGKTGGLPSFNISEFESNNQNGFVVRAPNSFDVLGYRVSWIGDFNGDGYDDFLATCWSGKAIIVLGRSTGIGNIDVSTFSTDNSRGILLTGGTTSSEIVGYQFSGIGDYNGDGLGDILATIGTQSIVIFGRSGPLSNIDLRTFVTSETTGYRITYTGSNARSGKAGDFNNDGFDDFLIGTGNPYLVLGKASGHSDIQLSSSNELTSTILISRSGTAYRTGEPFAGGENPYCAGDFNGDGFTDIAVNSPYSGNNGLTDSGSVYILFGHDVTTSVLNLSSASAPGSVGCRIDGHAGGYLGACVGTAGDVNNDGCDDLLAFCGRGIAQIYNGGCTYLIYGKPQVATNLDLETAFTPGTDGIRIDGPGRYVSSKAVFTTAGNFNGDSYTDFALAQAIDQSTSTLSTFVFNGGPSSASVIDWNEF